MLIISFSSLSVNEYGLDYSGISKNINPIPYQAGIYFLGISHHFIKFPKTVITIDFSGDPGADSKPISTRTSDGLEVQLSLSFQFKLQYDEIFKMYQKYKDNYKFIYELVAINVLSSLATEYSAYNFFMDRTTIGTAMQTQLNEIFKAECFSTIEFFQLKVVDLPDKFEESIQDSEVKKQSIQQAYATKNKNIIELETMVLTAEYQKNVTVNLAQGDGKQILFAGQAYADSLKIRQLANAQCYSQLKKTLNMQSKELLNYIRTKVVRLYEGDTLLISMKEHLPTLPATTSKQLRQNYEDEFGDQEYDQSSNEDEYQTEKVVLYNKTSPDSGHKTQQKKTIKTNSKNNSNLRSKRDSDLL